MRKIRSNCGESEHVEYMVYANVEQAAVKKIQFFSGFRRQWALSSLFMAVLMDLAISTLVVVVSCSDNDKGWSKPTSFPTPLA